MQERGVRALLRALLFSPGMLACCAFRLDQRWRRRHPVLASCVRRIAFVLTGVEIHPDARVGPGLRLAHTMGTVIGARVVIGADATIYQGVTLGAARLGEGLAGWEAYPVVGDRVTIYAGAMLLGRIRVGDEAVIGANSVVLEDVPAGAVAVGVPARLINPSPSAPGAKGSGS